MALLFCNPLMIWVGYRQCSRKGRQIWGKGSMKPSCVGTVPPTTLVAVHMPDIIELLDTTIFRLLAIIILATKPWSFVLIARVQTITTRTILLLLLSTHNMVLECHCICKCGVKWPPNERIHVYTFPEHNKYDVQQWALVKHDTKQCRLLIPQPQTNPHAISPSLLIALELWCHSVSMLTGVISHE